MNRRTQWLGLIGAVAVASLGFWLGPRMRQAPAEKTTKQGSTHTDKAARTVEVTKPERKGMSRVLDVPATMEAFERVELFAKTSGYISEVRVDIGDHVNGGDVLAVIDVPEMVKELAEAVAVHASKLAALKAADAKVEQSRRALDAAEAQRDRHQADVAMKEVMYQRRQELFRGQAIPREQLDEAEYQHQIAKSDLVIALSRIAAAQADIASAQAGQAMAASEIEVAAAHTARIETMLEYARITAPLDGVVTKRMVERGALVQDATGNRGMPLFVVERVDSLRIGVEIPEVDLAHVKPGAPLKVRPYARSDEMIDAQIARIAASLNPGTRTMRAEIDLPNSDGRLYPGMYAQVTIEVETQANALTLPASTLLTEGRQVFVYTVNDDRVKRTPVRIGLDDGIHVEVRDGLADDALVVTTGKSLVYDGTPVRPVLKANPS